MKKIFSFLLLFVFLFANCTTSFASTSMVITEKLNVDFRNKKVDALTEYLDKNLEGFDKNTCKLMYNKNFFIGVKCYSQLIYFLYYKGYQTDYSVCVAYDEDTLNYYSTIDEFSYEKANKSITMNAADIPMETIERAKKEAIQASVDYKDVPVGAQEVTKRLDEDCNPYLYILTFYKINEKENKVEEYQYNLNK